MGMIRVVRCTNAERIAYGGIEPGRIFFCTDTLKTWIGTAGGDLELGPPNVGVWTPAISFGLAAVGVVYGGSNGGRYSRFGDWVSITGWMVLTDKGSSVGNARIEDLPFTCKNSDSSYSPATVRLENVSFADQWTAWVVKNAAAIDLFEVNNAGVLSALTNANFANNSTVMMSATYEIEV